MSGFSPDFRVKGKTYRGIIFEIQKIKHLFFTEYQLNGRLFCCKDIQRITSEVISLFVLVGFRVLPLNKNKL